MLICHSGFFPVFSNFRIGSYPVNISNFDIEVVDSLKTTIVSVIYQYLRREENGTLKEALSSNVVQNDYFVASYCSRRKSGEAPPRGLVAFLQTSVVFDLFAYLHLSRVTRHMFSLVSVISGLFSYLVIRSSIGECILSHFIAGICPRV